MFSIAHNLLCGVYLGLEIVVCVNCEWFSYLKLKSLEVDFQSYCIFHVLAVVIRTPSVVYMDDLTVLIVAEASYLLPWPL